MEESKDADASLECGICYTALPRDALVTRLCDDEVLLAPSLQCHPVTLASISGSILTHTLTYTYTSALKHGTHGPP